MLTNLLPTAVLALTPFVLSNPIPPASPKRQTNLISALFGPITLPAFPSISNASITLVNFNDEVFDISSISIFGDVNDGGCTEAEDAPEPMASGAGRSVVLGPADVPWSLASIQNAQITLVNFNDEVFDVSSISIFGDVNDGTCPPAAA